MMGVEAAIPVARCSVTSCAASAGSLTSSWKVAGQAVFLQCVQKSQICPLLSTVSWVSPGHKYFMWSWDSDSAVFKRLIGGCCEWEFPCLIELGCNVSMNQQEVLLVNDTVP